MKKIIIFLVLCLVISNISHAQRNAAPKKEEIAKAKTLKKKFEDASVALVTSVDEVSFKYNKSLNTVSAIHTLKEELINLKTRSDIYYYAFYSGQSKINKFQIKYRTGKYFLPKISDEVYKSDGIFHNDSRLKSCHLDFPLLGYSYNTIVETKYKDLKYLTSLYFNSDYPAERKIIKFEVPDWLEIELKEMNFEGYDISKKEEKHKSSTTFIYTLKDVEASFNESNTPGPSYTYPHILLLPKAYTHKGKKVQLFESTQDLYNWYRSLVSQLKNDNSNLKEKVKELIKEAKSDDEKIKNIYYWVQDNIRYIAFEDGLAGFKPDEASTVFKNKYGDCKGMANLTKQMLVEAGFDARLTWIGTKRIAYDYSTPSLSVDNHMICTLMKDGEPIFLDGTEKYNAYGEYADRIQGKQVLIEDGKDYILKDVPEAGNDFSQDITTYDLSVEGEELKGQVTKKFTGEKRASFLYYYHNLKSDKKKEFLENFSNNRDKNRVTSNFEISNLDNREQDINLSYDITLKNAISSFDDVLYIDINFDKELASIDLKDRKTDFVFNYKKQIEATTHLKLPKGYSVSHIPENLSIENDEFNMQLSFSQEGDVLTYHKIFTLNNAMIPKKEFKDWGAFLKDLKNSYSEQIELTKNN